MDDKDSVNAKLLTLIESLRKMNDELYIIKSDLHTIKNILLVFLIFFLFGVIILASSST